MCRNSPKTELPKSCGAYDRLYACRDFLWPARPGRMVRKAVMLRATGRALDAGCGDGKNVAFLLDNGWTVEAFDISTLAIDACKRRLAEAGEQSCRIWTDDSRAVVLKERTYDIVVAYGLYHCLDDDGLQETHRRLTSALKRGGLFIYAAFNDAMPLPRDHATGNLYLRSKEHTVELFAGWNLIEMDVGIIEEHHLPLVAQHQHSLTWAIYEKVI